MLEAAGVIKQLITLSLITMIINSIIGGENTGVCVLVHVCPFGIIHFTAVQCDVRSSFTEMPLLLILIHQFFVMSHSYVN